MFYVNTKRTMDTSNLQLFQRKENGAVYSQEFSAYGQVKPLLSPARTYKVK